MFHWGFFELLIIFVVALVIVGPQRLPAVIRTMGYWIGWARSHWGAFSTQLNRDLMQDATEKHLPKTTKALPSESSLSQPS